MIAAFLLSSISCGQDVGAGDLAPRPQADRLFKCPYGHLDRLLGKGIVYVWFLPASTGSDLVRDLNAVQAVWRKRGVEVVAVTHRSESEVQAWVDRMQPTFTVVHESSNASMGAYPLTEWPAAVVVSAWNRVLYKGNPKEAIQQSVLQRAAVATRLEGPDAPLRLALDLPPSQDALSRALSNGKLTEALSILNAPADRKGARDAEHLAMARERLEALLGDTLRGATRDLDEKEYYRASLLAERIIKHAPGTRWEVDAKALLERMRGPGLVREKSAGAKLESAREAIESGQWAEAEKLLKIIIAKWSGTGAAEKAQRLLKSLR